MSGPPCVRPPLAQAAPLPVQNVQANQLAQVFGQANAAQAMSCAKTFYIPQTTVMRIATPVTFIQFMNRTEMMPVAMPVKFENLTAPAQMVQRNLPCPQGIPCPPPACPVNQCCEPPACTTGSCAQGPYQSGPVALPVPFPGRAVPVPDGPSAWGGWNGVASYANSYASLV